MNLPVPDPLPIDAVLPAILASLREQAGAVVISPTGSGKTTRIGPALLDSGLLPEGEVVVLEPRRLAARAAAGRVAHERRCKLGGEVGYHVRFDRRTSKKTRLRFVTEGLFLRELQADPFLEGVAAVVFDEFHERNLDGDLAFALARRVQMEVRPELRILVMSATLDPAPVATFLGDGAVHTSEGRSFPVEITYEAPLSGEETLGAAARVVREALKSSAGDLLVFLPGVGEIRRLERELATLKGAAIVPLFGDLAADSQDRALVRGSGRRVILSTNVAEASVTVEGVDTVIDTGLVRLLRHDPNTGLNRLVPERISRASADQRAGRAGRLGPGRCIRLWSEWDQRALPVETEPEVRRSELSGAVLQLLAFGEHDPAAFPWFERPRSDALEAALLLLDFLGATQEGSLTELGRRMSDLPVEPRLARLLCASSDRGHAEAGALAVALLSERSPFTRTKERRSAAHTSTSDLVDRVEALAQFERNGARRGGLGEIHIARARHLLAVRDQLLRSLGDSGGRGRGAIDASGLERAIFEAFADRLARRREPGSPRAVAIDGRGVCLDAASAVSEAELFVCLEMQAGKSEALVRVASAVESDWLAAEGFDEVEELGFDSAAEKVTSKRRRTWRGLALDEREAPVQRDDRTSQALAEAAEKALESALGLDRPEVRSFLMRVRCLGVWCPELELPSFTDEDLVLLLPELCAGLRSFRELRSLPLATLLRARLTHEQAQALEREAPERLQVPSGPRLALVYREGAPPVLPARIQQLFGWQQTPRIARGRVPVLLHLLAPNGRPQQVTDDLAGFWVRTYPLVRKELRRRYPKHAWPEVPPGVES